MKPPSETYDPTESLKKIRSLMKEIYTTTFDVEFQEYADSLINELKDLDEWLSNMGELPSDWQG